jgi:dihydrofolate reductase
MNILLDISISLNGFIARENGDEDWISDDGWINFQQVAEKYNNFVLGRETYEQVTSRNKKYNFDNVKCEHKVIVTRDRNFLTLNGYAIVLSPEQAVQYIESKGCDKLFLAGGGKLSSSFIKAGLVDELSITVNPHVIGKGRPMFGPDDFDLPLKLSGHEEISSGRIRIRYEVIKQLKLN